jgi:hypothetical protein
LAWSRVKGGILGVNCGKAVIMASDDPERAYRYAQFSGAKPSRHGRAVPHTDTGV